MVTNKELNDHREDGCWAVLYDKKYYHVGNSCIKRTLRRHEWQTNLRGDVVIPPRSYPQRWKTDAAVLQYLSIRTDIPLPRFQCAFQDDGAFYHLTEYVPGVAMNELNESQKRVVEKEVLRHIRTLKTLRSNVPGVPGDALMCPPLRVTSGKWKADSCWKVRADVAKGDYIFCHNDLGQHNIIVDPNTLKINAIIDWEFGGFWPEWFERAFWERHGPSHAMEGEDDDTDRCRKWLLEYCDEVVMPFL
ncbi:protein kinase-like protein [Zalerion maritima]|uniref:Protein kinase-like protein n=1 Tax=Zalerion maritima TaxID=339359 RepID=A0AAD5WNE9_9PEZI|nr:protein kinase-like protein [Zalerion maritima]